MGFFDWVFRMRKGEMQTATEEKIDKVPTPDKPVDVGIRAKEMKELVSKDISDFLENFSRNLSSYISNLDESLKILESKNFKGQKVDPRLLKILLDNKSNFTSSMRRAMKRINSMPQNDAREIRKYLDGCQSILSEAIRSTELNRQKISEYMSGNVFPVMRDVNSLIDFINSEKTKIMKTLYMSEKLNSFEEKLEEKKKLSSNIQKLKNDFEKISSEMDSLKKEKGTKENELFKLLKSEKYSEMENIRTRKNSAENEIKKIEEDFVNYLSVLHRPLKKLLNVAEKNTALYMPKSYETALNELRLDKKSVLLIREILPSLKTAVEKNDISLKKDERERVIGKINDIFETSSLENFLRRKNKILEEITNLENKMKDVDTSDKDRLESEISQIENQIDSKKKNSEELKSLMEKLSSKISNLEKIVENEFDEIFRHQRDAATF